MTIRVGQRNHRGHKLVGYNVYHAPDGCTPSYYGRATSLRQARRMSRGGSLEQSLWGTARAAGHCAGLHSPETGEKEIEDEDGACEWWGRDGFDCAVCIWEVSQ